MSKRKSKVLFASAKPGKMEREQTLPARFMKLLDQLRLARRVKGRTVAIKMHLGGGLGYSTIHPLFVKLLVDHLKKAKARSIFITDGDVKTASDRGYAKETVGARLIPAFGKNGKAVVRRRTGWPRVKSVLLSKPVLEADVLVNFSHVKGHGDCGFGGACKNIAMGCVPGKTRRDLHSLEGKLKWDKAKCIRCNKCIKECPTGANKFTKEGEYEIFWHHCKMCVHCMLACPTGAIQFVDRKFDRFQEGLARVTKLVLDDFKPADRFHINVLTHITIFCDCWGFTTPALVPDIGIVAGQDIVAVESATLDRIRVRDLIPGAVTAPYELGKRGHLFERLHHRDPYVQVKALERLGAGTRRYTLVTVE